MAKVTNEDMETLLAMAKVASYNAYAPYSKFRVGAAIQTKSGIRHAGCNVENANYSLTLHAEHNALGRLVSASGVADIEAVVIYTPTQEAALPCGSCRQALHEFSPNATIISVCDNPKSYWRGPLSKLLPHAFGPHNLEK